MFPKLLKCCKTPAFSLILKSHLIASQSISFLGFNINWKTMSISLPADKKFDLFNLCTILLDGEQNFR